MTNQESFMRNEIAKVLAKLDPELKELTKELNDITANVDNPLVLGLLIAQLINERKKTNEILEEINRKIDELKGLKPKTEELTAILPESDQLILKLAEQKGMIEAKDVKEALGYAGLNAASQRLNKLYREGHLSKIRSGKKVYFFLKGRPFRFQHHPTPRSQSPHG